MIYVDTSVVLAQLLLESRRPSRSFWTQPLIASRLLEYEVWNRLHARPTNPQTEEAARTLIARISLVELSPIVLGRALEPFPIPCRTLDALHLATLEFLRSYRLDPELATYDRRLADAARALGVSVTDFAS